MHDLGEGAPELLFHQPSLPRCMKSLVHLVSWMYYLLSCAYNVPSRTWMYDFVTLSSTYDRERRKNDLVCRMYDLICRMCDLVCRMDDLVSHAYVRCQSSILTKKWSNYNAWNCENMPINVEIKNNKRSHLFSSPILNIWWQVNKNDIKLCITDTCTNANNKNNFNS